MSAPAVAASDQQSGASGALVSYRVVALTLTMLAAALVAAAVLVAVSQPAAAHKVQGYIHVDDSAKTIAEGESGTFKVCRTSPRDDWYFTSTKGLWFWEVRPYYGKDSSPASLSDIHPDQRSGVVKTGYWAQHIWDRRDERVSCKNFTIEAVNDNIVEPTETFYLVLTRYEHKNHHPDGAGLTYWITVDIIDNDVGVLSVADSTVTEGQDLEFAIGMNGVIVPGGHTVTPTILINSHERSAEKEDFASQSIQLEPIEFEGHANEQHTLVIPTLDDAIAENTERLELLLKSSNPNVDTAEAVGLIIDNDEADVAFVTTTTTTTSSSGVGAANVRVGDVTADEGYEAVYTVSLGSTPTEHPFTVTVTPKQDTQGAKAAKPNAPGTAYAHVDYFHKQQVFRFEGEANESHSGSVLLTANLDEPTVSGCTTDCTERDNETFLLDVEVSRQLGTVNPPAQDATVTIRNSAELDIVVTVGDDRRNEGDPIQTGVKNKFVIPIMKNHVFGCPANTGCTPFGNITVKAKVTGGTAAVSDYVSENGKPKFTCWDKYPSAQIDPSFNRSDATQKNTLETRVDGKSVAAGHHCALEGDKPFDAVFLEFEATPDSIRESDETITFGFETAVYHDDSTAPTVRNEMSSTVTLQNDDFERPVLEFVHCERDHSTDPCELDENGGSVEVRAALPTSAPAEMWLSLDLLPDTSRVYSPAAAGDARLSSASLHIPKGSKLSSDTVTVTAVDNDVWTDGYKQMSVQARVHSTLPMGAGAVTGIGFNIVEDDTKVLLISPDTRPKTPGNPKATGPVVLSEGGEGFWSEIRLSSRPSDTLRLTPAALPAGNGFSDKFTVRNAAGQTGSDATLTWTKPNDENDDPDWWRTVRRLEVIPPTDAADTDAYDSQARVHLTARIRARLTVGSMTHNAATLTLTGRTGSWWLKRTAPTTGACTAKASGVYTHNLTGLDDKKVYAYTAYTDSACTTAVDTAAFTTLGKDPLTASSVTHDTATLTLTNGRGVWGLKRTAPSPAGACTAKASGVYTHNLTGLDASTAYTYTAYTDSACTTAIGTADFTTPAGTLTVGSVTHNAATLTLTGRTGAWGLRRTTPTAGTCTAMASGVYTHNLTGLDASTAYTYTFYTDSACTTAIGSHTATFATTTTAGAQYYDMWPTAVISAVERDNDARLIVGGPDGWGNSLTVTEGAVDADDNPEPVSYTLKLSGRPSAAANDNEQVPILVSLDTASAGSSDASLTLESGKCDDSGANARVTSKEVYFTQANWDTAQTVNVYACEDDDIRSAQVSVTHTVLEKQRSGGRVTILDTNAAWTRLNGLTGSWAEQALPGVDIGVIDNDGTLITLELQDANGNAINAIPENGGVATVVAKLAAAVTGDVTVRVRTQAQVNTTSSDYAVKGSTLTIPAGATDSTTGTTTVTITGRDDDTDDPPKAVLVTATASSSSAVTGPAAVPLTLTDDDIAGLTVTPATLTVDEGGTKTYTVQLASRPGGAVAVTPVVPTDHTSDIAVSPQLLTFTRADWDTPQTVTVAAAVDDEAADITGIELSHVVQPSEQSSYYGYAELVQDLLANLDSVQLSELENFLKDIASRRGPVTVTVADTSAAVSVSTSALRVAEGSTNGAVYSVVLGAKPAAAVTVTAQLPSTRDTDLRFAASNGTGSCPSAASPNFVKRTFTASNWYQAKDIKVCAAEDTDTAAGTATIAHTATGTGSGFENLTIPTVTLTESDNDAAGLRFAASTGQDTLAAYGEAFVREGVATALGAREITVTRTRKPTDPVTATVQVSGDGFTVGATDETAESAVTLTFPADDSTVAQSFWVHSAADDDAAVNTGTVTLTLASDDIGYAPTDPEDALDPSFRVIQIDDDTAGIEVDTRSLGVREGGSASLRMRLTAEPSAEVRVYPTLSGDPDLRVSPARVTFTSTDWNSWHTVTVHAAQDSDTADGTAVVDYVVVSDDDHYHGLTAPDATVTLIEGDNETASTMFSALGVDVPEGGSASYGVSLTHAPNADVTVRLHPQSTTSGGDADLTADTDKNTLGNQHLLRFNSGNWTKPQYVTISNANPGTGDDDVGKRLFVHTSSSSDRRYDAADHHPLTATELKTAELKNRVLISPSSLRLTTDTDQYISVRLARDPCTNKTDTCTDETVTLYLVPLGDASVIVQPPRLTFTGGDSGTWNIPKVVTLRLNSSGAGVQQQAAQARTRTGGAGAATTAAAQGSVTAQAATAGTSPVLRLQVTSNEATIDSEQVPATEAAQTVVEPEYTPPQERTPSGGSPSIPPPSIPPSSVPPPTVQTDPLFTDIAGSTHAASIRAIAAAGITRGCTPTTYCPNKPLTRGEMATLLTRALKLPAASDAISFTDIAGSTHAASIRAIAAAGITRGCTPTTYCPNKPLTRGEMATLLTRALKLPAASDAISFTDIAGSTHAASIRAIAAAGITRGCTPTTYCPNKPLTRGEMATLLTRALKL